MVCLYRRVIEMSTCYVTIRGSRVYCCGIYFNGLRFPSIQLGIGFMNSKQLFHLLYEAKNEQQVSAIIERYPDVFASKNWKPLGGNKGNIGTVESQQSNATAALVEKITNSVDAILMKKCLESGVDPKSSTAPRSMEQAVEWFFPGHQHWDLTDRLKSQALDIQIIADSEPRDTSNTSLIVYDNGEGQHPEDFKKTFLSLHNNNKNEVHFVQGRYNMGGSGAIMFCGRKYYQLIGSKRFRNDGDFGFTLVRQYPLSDEEEMTQKRTRKARTRLPRAGRKQKRQKSKADRATNRHSPLPTFAPDAVKDTAAGTRACNIHST